MRDGGHQSRVKQRLRGTYLANDQRRNIAYVWATWLAPFLAAERQCAWSLWYRANYVYEKRPDTNAGNLAKWKGEHGDMVQRRADHLRLDDWCVYTEQQNAFKVKGRTAILAGCPDIVAVRTESPEASKAFAATGEADMPAQAVVEDCKTGKRRDTDIFQVHMYIQFLPRIHPALGQHQLVGSVVYKDGNVSVSADASIHERTIELMRSVAEAEPTRTPSVGECARCDIANCPDRMDGDELQVETEAF